jgi:hypothetical protein
MLVNLLFNTRPVVVHAHGPHNHKPFWKPIRDRFFSSEKQTLGKIEQLTILTWNNGHEAMGLLEKSLAHLGVPCLVLGAGIEEWVNSIHKPVLTAESLARIDTEFVMGIDSRDAILLDNPQTIVDCFLDKFSCHLVFSADRINWPNIREFKEFEDSLPGAQESEFRYLNSGAWIGRTEFCKDFFSAAVRTEVVDEEPKADQGIFKKLFKRYYPQVQLDYRCQMFQNIGFVFDAILDIN